jgi:hypothetical protein
VPSRTPTQGQTFYNEANTSVTLKLRLKIIKFIVLHLVSVLIIFDRSRSCVCNKRTGAQMTCAEGNVCGRFCVFKRRPHPVTFVPTWFETTNDVLLSSTCFISSSDSRYGITSSAKHTLTWMLSFFMARGRLTPCNLKYRPQALHTGSPTELRLHRDVVLVWQLEHDRPTRRDADCNNLQFTC